MANSTCAQIGTQIELALSIQNLIQSLASIVLYCRVAVLRMLSAQCWLVWPANWTQFGSEQAPLFLPWRLVRCKGSLAHFAHKLLLVEEKQVGSFCKVEDRIQALEKGRKGLKILQRSQQCSVVNVGERERAEIE